MLKCSSRVDHSLFCCYKEKNVICAYYRGSPMKKMFVLLVFVLGIKNSTFALEQEIDHRDQIAAESIERHQKLLALGIVGGAVGGLSFAGEVIERLARLIVQAAQTGTEAAEGAYDALYLFGGRVTGAEWQLDKDMEIVNKNVDARQDHVNDKNDHHNRSLLTAAQGEQGRQIRLKSTFKDSIAPAKSSAYCASRASKDAAKNTLNKALQLKGYGSNCKKGAVAVAIAAAATGGVLGVDALAQQILGDKMPLHTIVNCANYEGAKKILDNGGVDFRKRWIFPNFFGKRISNKDNAWKWFDENFSDPAGGSVVGTINPSRKNKDGKTVFDLAFNFNPQVCLDHDRERIKIIRLFVDRNFSVPLTLVDQALKEAPEQTSVELVNNLPLQRVINKAHEDKTRLDSFLGAYSGRGSSNVLKALVEARGYEEEDTGKKAVFGVEKDSFNNFFIKSTLDDFDYVLAHYPEISDYLRDSYASEEMVRLMASEGNLDLLKKEKKCGAQFNLEHLKILARRSFNEKPQAVEMGKFLVNEGVSSCELPYWAKRFAKDLKRP